MEVSNEKAGDRNSVRSFTGDPNNCELLLTGHPSGVLGYHAVLKVDSATGWMIHFWNTGRTAASSSHSNNMAVVESRLHSRLLYRALQTITNH